MNKQIETPGLRYLLNRIQSNRADSSELKKKGNIALSQILDDESKILESIFSQLQIVTTAFPPPSIQLNGAEIQSGRDRVYWAEKLIEQLDPKHDGRNSWLLNYGRGELGEHLREQRDIKFNETTQSAETV